MEILQREIIFLTCDKQEFEDWFLSEYPESKIFGMGKPLSHLETAPGWDNLGIEVGYTLELGKHKYIFEYRESENRLINFELFLSAIRNKFLLPEIIKGEPITYRNKGGAHAIEEYDRAWEEMQAGVKLDLAYQHYLEFYGMHHEKREKDKFRNAMNRRDRNHKALRMDT